MLFKEASTQTPGPGILEETVSELGFLPGKKAIKEEEEKSEKLLPKSEDVDSEGDLEGSGQVITTRRRRTKKAPAAASSSSRLAVTATPKSPKINPMVKKEKRDRKEEPTDTNHAKKKKRHPPTESTMD